MSFTVAANGNIVWVKDPDSIKDYGWDLTDLLDAGDSVQSCTFTPDDASGITVTQHSIVGSVCYAWLSGGTLDGTWGVTCRYTTTGGRTDDKTMYFKIKQT
jgi:hypothetical protein